MRGVFGYALYQAQVGLKHRDAKPLRGLGGNVMEVSSRHDGDAFRLVYTVRFRSAVYVLHAFQKKATRRIATPKHEIDVVRRRLEAAQRHHGANLWWRVDVMITDEDDVERGSGNVLRTCASRTPKRIC